MPIILAGFWIALSEFVRNELLFKSYWVDHFNSIGLLFITTPLNGVLWLVWSLLLAYSISIFLQKFTFTQTVFLNWLVAFVMMWVVIYNLQVLPIRLLLFAIPLSLLEVFVATWIIGKLSQRQTKT